MNFADLFNVQQPQGAATAPVPVPQGAQGQLQPAQIQAAAPAPGQGFNDVVNNPAQSLMVGPPKSPEEVQARKSQWSQVLDAFAKDPNLNAMLLRIGTQMLQPLEGNQTPGGQFGVAIQDGMDFLTNREELDRRRKADEMKLGLDKARTEADIESSKATTATRKYELTELQKNEGVRERKIGLELTKLENDIAGAKDEAELRRIQKRVGLLTEEMKTVERAEFMKPENAALRQKLRGLEVQLTEAQIAAQNRSGRHTPTESDKTADALLRDPNWVAAKTQEIVSDGGTVSEDALRSLARQEAGATVRNPGSQSGVVAATKLAEEQYRKANPQKPGESTAVYEQRVSKAMYEYMLKMPQLIANTTGVIPGYTDNYGMYSPAEPAAEGAPEAPRDPADRQENQLYTTPRGVLRWTAGGWAKP